jgi:hypothetical protein
VLGFISHGGTVRTEEIQKVPSHSFQNSEDNLRDRRAAVRENKSVPSQHPVKRGRGTVKPAESRLIVFCCNPYLNSRFPIDTQAAKRNMLQIMATRQITQRMKDYRTRLRQQGLRPVQIWVPDQRAPRFMEELERQVKNLSEQDENETLDLLERISDWPEE